MADAPPRTFWNPDGYVEIVFAGVQTPEQIREADTQARELMVEYGDANVLIDARQGRIGRDAASFSVVMKLSRNRNLKRLIILIDQTPAHPEAGRESGVIISMVTAALGKRPIYIYDEVAARALAATD